MWTRYRAPLAVCEGQEPADAGVVQSFRFNVLADVYLWSYGETATPLGRLSYVVTNDAALETLRRASVPIHQCVDSLIQTLGGLGELRVVARPFPFHDDWEALWHDSWLRVLPDISIINGVALLGLLVLVWYVAKRRR